MHCFMLEYVRAALGWVAFQTGLILCFQCRAAAEMNRAFVRRMTFRAIHPTLGNGMMTRQIELAAHIPVTGETNSFTCARRRCRKVGAKIVRHRATGREAVRCFGFSARFRMDAGRAVA